MIPAHYSVKIINLTAGQPLSPPAYVIHDAKFSAFSIGFAASVGVEKIAESGNSSDFIAAAKMNPGVLKADVGVGGIAPGHEQIIDLNLQTPSGQLAGLKLSYLSMLGNTNDGFASAQDVAIGQLSEGASLTLDALSYDAGTEKNTESATTVPGPACGGEGFNAERSDGANIITLHPGIVSKQDGDENSCLQTLQRWDNPVVRVIITRLAI